MCCEDSFLINHFIYLSIYLHVSIYLSIDTKRLLNPKNVFNEAELCNWANDEMIKNGRFGCCSSTCFIFRHPWIPDSDWLTHSNKSLPISITVLTRSSDDAYCTILRYGATLLEDKFLITLMLVAQTKLRLTTITNSILTFDTVFF